MFLCSTINGITQRICPFFNALGNWFHCFYYIGKHFVRWREYFSETFVMIFQTLWNSQWNYDIFFLLLKTKNNARKWRDKIKMWPIPCVVPGIWNFQIIMTLVEKSKMTVFQPRFSFWKIFAEEQAENGITYVVVFNAAATFLHFISSYEKSRFQNSSQPRRGTWITRPIFGR